MSRVPYETSKSLRCGTCPPGYNTGRRPEHHRIFIVGAYKAANTRSVMVKAYLSYEAAASFGVIATASVPAVPLPASSHPVPHIVAAGVDAVLVWNVRKGEVVARYSNSATRKSAIVTSIAVSSDGRLIAAGYSDGSIRTWPVSLNEAVDVLPEKEPVATFNGHRSHVTSIAFESFSRGSDSKTAPNRIVSGSADGDVILWDLAGEAGIFRVAAHNDVVTSVILMKHNAQDIFISSSKDGLVRIYDIDTQHCLQTLAGHRAEVWAMTLDPTHSLLLTGSVDADVRLFRFKEKHGPENEGEEGSLDLVDPLGSVQRKTAAARVRTIHCGMCHGEVFALVGGNDRNAELFRVRSKDGANNHRQRRKKRALAKVEKRKEAEKAENGNVQDDMEEKEFTFTDTLQAKDFLVSVRAFKMLSKIRGMHVLSDTYQFSTQKSNTLDVRFLLQTADNALEVFKLIVSSQNKQKKRKRGAEQGGGILDEEEVHASKQEVGVIEKVVGLDRSGHRNDVRSISLSPDDRLMLSTSKKSLKLWNIALGSCVRSMEPAGYGLCTTFLGADGAFAAVGTKEGSLDIFDLGSGSLVKSISSAHDGPVWSMTLDNHIYEADMLISGGADKKICFWSINDLLSDANETAKTMPSRSMRMPDEILCVRVAKRERPIVLVSLMDATVRAVFMDDLEPAMNFYGHKLPVMAMDVSSDGLLLATGSADKTLKLWGIDFGDCRRSLRAHSDSVVSVRFQPNTHYFFSGSRDGTLKYWDGDKGEFISELPGQRGEVWSIGISGDGEMVATASHDKMLRVWRRTDEPLFLQEEEDKRMDEMFESTLIDDDIREAKKSRGAQIEFLDDGSAGEALRAGKVSLDTVKGGEKLLEALALYEEETNRQLQNDSDEAPNPYLLGMRPDAYLLRTLEQIRTADLDEVMHFLPLSEGMALLGYVCDLLKPDMKMSRLSVEVLIRTAVQLMKLHQNQVISGACDRATVALLLERIQREINDLRSRFGFNIAGLGFWQSHLAEQNNAAFRDASSRAYNLNTKRKKKAVVRSK